LDLIKGLPPYHALRDLLQDGHAAGDLGLLRAARPYLTMALATDLNRPILYIAGRVNRAHNITEQLPVWAADTRVLRYAEPGPLFYEYAPWSETTIQGRLGVLATLCPPPLQKHQDPPPVIVTSARALMQKTLPVREFRAGSRLLKRGSLAEPEKLLRTLLGLGYAPATITVEPGTFSRRGGIIDIYPVAAAQPVRFEFFGDEVESLRPFDPASQRSEGEIEQIAITPAREALPKLAPPVAERLADWFASQPEPDEAVVSTRTDAEALGYGAAFPGIEYYLPYLYSYPAGLLDFVPDDTLILVDDWADLRAAVEDLELQAVGLRQEKLDADQLPSDYPLPYLTWDELYDSITTRTVLHLGESDPLADPVENTLPPLSDLFTSGPRFSGQIKPFLDHVFALRYHDRQTIVVTRQAQRLAELWGQQDTYLKPTETVPTLDDLGTLQFVEGALAEGWSVQHGLREVHLLTDAEIFGWKRPEPRRLRRRRPNAPEASFADLEPGSYVVHVEYGIGRFAGLQKRIVNGNEREYLVIQYAGTDQLFVPIHQADRLARYVGATDRPPQLSRLGTPDWTRTKESTKAAVAEVAKELLELYALRANVTGHAFNPDTPWQHELEAAFPYVETDDQLRAIDAVKLDMESPKPMDRLICGDAGYGKTEVALRAAFKAVMDGKQVAMLVPTTVLAQQHFNTFTRRLATFPVKIEMLSRFRDRRAQSTILNDLAAGQVDIVIGTHRLLQSDVEFKDLGLLIIDEEQRFGVTHKETLKRLRTEIDVLTMTATPIPRTLYMALTGLRDISTIQTPPEERLPVNTYIGTYDRRMTREAVLREIERGGQVYFVHNRVQTIETQAAALSKLVPEARIAVAHGQMDETQLERIMFEFAQGETDVLVSTSIIESGLDIPNANTLIVDRADWFGLAQLYQLRGRVGRGAARAYAYFFHPPFHRLTDDALARLETIKAQNELGAGFQIAMRDLEIRGAGDILGARQSGHIAAVGFHLYTQLLSQAVQRSKNGSKLANEPDDANGPTVTIDLPSPAYIPTDFIPDVALRLQLYRRLADLPDDAAIDEMGDEMTDRFGPLPEAVTGLLYQLKVKQRAQGAQATAIGNENGQVYIRLPYLAEVDRTALQHYLANDVRVSRTAVWLPRDLPQDEWQARLLDLLDRLDRQNLQVTGA
ncbi:MAG: transcription-repair coupling factor, partial [Anaerolineae bacterium]|nr:transcription-repair coupling factor [Anaerolineae bacterium]